MIFCITICKILPLILLVVTSCEQWYSVVKERLVCCNFCVFSFTVASRLEYNLPNSEDILVNVRAKLPISSSLSTSNGICLNCPICTWILACVSCSNGRTTALRVYQFTYETITKINNNDKAITHTAQIQRCSAEYCNAETN